MSVGEDTPFVGDPTIPPEVDFGTVTLPPRPIDDPDRIGRFRIERKLGAGGMGAVYLAHDEQLDRQVALKVPHSRTGLLDKRFSREARLAAGLRHPNICPIYEFGEADGVPYLCMPFVKGESLARKIVPCRPFPVTDAVRIVATVARAMAMAHDQAVIHRDLKPANILIDESGEPIVMDFGLARRDEPVLTHLTAAGDVLGTPPYMPPEQIAGETEKFGPACDIYSLGIIFYELLTGTTPFVGDLISLAGQIACDEPMPPSQRRRDLDPNLDRLCLKALEKRQEDRWLSMRAFADALEAYLTFDAAAPTLMLRVVCSGIAYRAAAGQRRITAGRQRRRADLPTGEGNDLVLRVTGDDQLSMRISRRQFEIDLVNGEYQFTDRSKIGSRLNDRPLTRDQPYPLSNGDRVSVADVLTLEVVLANSNRQAKPLENAKVRAANGPGEIVFEVTCGDIVSLFNP